MKPTEKKTTRLRVVNDLRFRLLYTLVLFALVIVTTFVIIYGLRWGISFVQNPSATWHATWSHVIKGLTFRLGMLIQILIELLICGLFIIVLVGVRKLYFGLLHGRKINKQLFAQEDFRNTNLRKLTCEMRELADDIYQNNYPHDDLTLRIYRITITIGAMTGRYSLIRRIIWNFTELVSQIIRIIRLIIWGVYKTPKEKLSDDLLRAERILDDFILQQSCSEYYKEHISKKLRALADKIDNNQTKIFRKAKREIELLVQNKAESATDSKSYSDLSKYQKCMFWVVHIMAFFLLFLVIGWLSIYFLHFFRWLG